MISKKITINRIIKLIEIYQIKIFSLSRVYNKLKTTSKILFKILKIYKKKMKKLR